MHALTPTEAHTLTHACTVTFTHTHTHTQSLGDETSRTDVTVMSIQFIRLFPFKTTLIP